MNSSDFGQLLIFHSIAQENSISGAAKRLGIAVPSVSKSLKNLEKKIGMPLFLRSTREPHGTVRITLSQVHFELIFKPVYAEFCRRYPDIVLEFSINNATVDLVAEHFDLGLRLGHSLNDNVIAKRVYPTMRQGLYVSEAYAERHGIPQSIDELHRHKIISLRFMSSGKIEPFFLNVNGEAQPFDHDNSLIFNDLLMIADATQQGMGIGRIFEPLAPKQGLIPVLEPHWISFPESYIYYPPMSHQPKKVRVLLDFLAEQSEIE